MEIISKGQKLSQEAKRCEDRLEIENAAKLHLAARNSFKLALEKLGNNNEAVESLKLLEKYHKNKAKQLKQLILNLPPTSIVPKSETTSISIHGSAEDSGSVPKEEVNNIVRRFHDVISLEQDFIAQARGEASILPEESVDLKLLRNENQLLKQNLVDNNALIKSYLEKIEELKASLEDFTLKYVWHPDDSSNLKSKPAM